MAKLLWLGSSPGHIGGQSRVAQAVIPHLKAFGWEVIAAGRNTAILHDGESAICPCYPWDVNNIDSLRGILKAHSPNVVLFSHDVWLLYDLPKINAEIPHIKWVGWLTIDAHPIHQSWLGILRAFDVVTTTTQFGRATIYSRYPEKSIEAIPYGVDSKWFQPAKDRKALKRKFGLDNNLPNFEDSIVFSFTGMNQVKKNIGAIVDSFNALNNPNYQLILAVKAIPSQVGTYTYEGEYDLSDMSGPRIHIIPTCLDNDQHLMINQITDVLVYPSQGEAPGLQISEAQLCGAIPIVTGYAGSPEETCVEAGILTEFLLHRGQFNCYRAIVNCEELAKVMDALAKFWQAVYSGEEYYIQEYLAFQQRVQRKFETRTWHQSATLLSNACRSTLENNLRVDDQLTPVFV